MQTIEVEVQTSKRFADCHSIEYWEKPLPNVKHSSLYHGEGLKNTNENTKVSLEDLHNHLPGTRNSEKLLMLFME